MKLICSICREKFSPSSEVSVVECGHIFHKNCIGKWCETSLTCPYCRFKMRDYPIRIEFDIKTEVPVAVPETDRDKLMRDLEVLREEERELKLKCEEIKKDVLKLEGEEVEAEKKAKRWTHYINVWDKEYGNAKNVNIKGERLKRENLHLEPQVNLLTRLKKLISGSESEMYDIIVGKSITLSTVEELCTYVQVMRHTLKHNRKSYNEKNTKLTHLNDELEKELLKFEMKKNEIKQVSDKSVQTTGKFKRRRHVGPASYKYNLKF